MKITSIEFERAENAGCNNGKYIPYTVKFDDGTVYEGETCRCHCGCSGSDRTDFLQVGMEFCDLDDFYDCIEWR